MVTRHMRLAEVVGPDAQRGVSCTLALAGRGLKALLAVAGAEQNSVGALLLLLMSTTQQWLLAPLMPADATGPAGQALTDCEMEQHTPLAQLLELVELWVTQPLAYAGLLPMLTAEAEL